MTLAKVGSMQPMINQVDDQRIKELTEELDETMYKRQVFRTETEMLFSVLNDAQHPTPASKYWQSVREQGVHYGELVTLSFRYRKNELKIRRLEDELAACEDELDAIDKQIDLDEALYTRQNQQIVAKDRVREIDLWSRIKAQCVKDDPDFNTDDVNAHQSESYLQRLEHRRQTLTSGSSQSEVFNVLGPLNTLRRLEGLPIIPFEETMKEISNGH
jgi:vacuolar-type H+-ATPase subunit I/STV1